MRELRFQNYPGVWTWTQRFISNGPTVDSLRQAYHGIGVHWMITEHTDNKNQSTSTLYPLATTTPYLTSNVSTIYFNVAKPAYCMNYISLFSTKDTIHFGTSCSNEPKVKS